MSLVYMEVTMDNLELPLAVADTPSELAELRGCNKQAIYKSISRIQLGQRKTGRYLKVDIGDEEFEPV